LWSLIDEHRSNKSSKGREHRIRSSSYQNLGASAEANWWKPRRNKLIKLERGLNPQESDSLFSHPLRSKLYVMPMSTPNSKAGRMPWIT
jgi:hypothetical protein